MRHLESAVLPDAVAVRVERDERVGDVADGNRRGQDVHRDALGVEDDPDALRDVEVYLDLRDAFPFGAGLRDQTPELVGRFVALPMPGLYRHAPRTGGYVLGNRYAKGARRVRARGRPRHLHDHAAGRCGRGPRIVGVARIGTDLPDRGSGRHEVGIGRSTEDRADLDATELDPRHRGVRGEEDRRSDGRDRDGRERDAIQDPILTRAFSGRDELRDPLDP